MASYQFISDLENDLPDTDKNGILMTEPTRRYIPNNLDNQDWAGTPFIPGYLQWVTAGNVPLPSDQLTDSEKWAKHAEKVDRLMTISAADMAPDVRLKGQGKKEVEDYREIVRFIVEDNQLLGVLPDEVIYPIYPDLIYLRQGPA